MKKIRVKYFVVGMLLILEIVSLTLMYKSSHNKEIVLDEVKLKDSIKNDMISIMTDETGNGTYTEYTKSNTFPNKSYTYNSSKSQCINEKGSIVKDVLTFDGTKAVLTSNEGMHCTLYFDKIIGPLGTLRENDDENQITDDLVGGMYRYQGTDGVNNWICFGTTKKDKCTSTDGIYKYMYRIIGVTSDGQLALIKETGIKESGTFLFWNDKDDTTESECGTGGSKCNWNTTEIYNRLNGLCNSDNPYCYNIYNTNMFINSKDYDYLVNDSAWLERINDHTWKYGDTTSDGNYNGDTIYKIENNFSKNIKAKIGLQYIHDYYYAYPGGNPETAENAKNSWINIGKDGLSTITWEWFLTRYDTGYSSIIYAYRVGTSGNVTKIHLTAYGGTARPVFYLKPDTVLKSGSTGSKEDPYIIDGILEEPEIATELRKKDDKNQLTEDLVGGMYRYQGTDGVDNWICFGTSDNDTCTSTEGIDKYMYRIIGITLSGEIALIKETGVKENGTTTSFQWNDKQTSTDCGADGSKCTWPLSRIYNRLNGLCTSSNTNCSGTGAGVNGQTNIFIGNSYYEYLSNSTWLNKIDENHSWKYGYTDNNNGNYNGDTIYAIESQFSNSINAKIGLQYIHDYYYAYPDGNPKDDYIAENAWIFFRKDNYNSAFTGEWLISNSTVGVYAAAYHLYAIGDVTGQQIGGNGGVRPVFYLKPDVKISSGAGTKVYPFIITP